MTISLRETLQPVIIELTKAIDYWSEMNMRGKGGPNSSIYYSVLVKKMESLKLFIIEEERRSYEDNQKLRISSRSDGGLLKEKNVWMEDSGVESFGSTRN